MASRFLGVAFEATEFFSPLMNKIGLSKWFRYLDVTSLIRAVLINPRQLVVWFKELSASSAAIKTALVAWAGSIVWDDIESKIDELYDKHEGDAKEFMFSLVNDAICAAINDAILQKFGVTTNISKLYPLDDPVVLENIMFELGRVVAKELNVRFGTNMVSVYPLDNVAQSVKTQLLSEIQGGARRILSNQDIASLLDGLNKLRDSAFIGETAQGGIVIMPQGSIAEELAYRRALARARQRKYRLTHERVSHAWKLKGT